MVTAQELFAQVATTRVRNICLTGGEPFVQPNDELGEFVELLLSSGHTVECFTNGSFRFPLWALAGVQLMMDWKLEGSGEATTQRATRTHNAEALRAKDGIKFVVTSNDDLEEALHVARNIQLVNERPQIWVGAAWDRIKEADVVDFVLQHKLSWRLNTQLHKYIWPPDARGV